VGPDVRDTAAGGTLEAVSTLVMSANLYTEAEFSDLIVQAHPPLRYRAAGRLPSRFLGCHDLGALYCVRGCRSAGGAPRQGRPQNLRAAPPS